MLSAASGEQVAALEARQYDSMVRDYGSLAVSLKHYLAKDHFQRKYSRFQLRLLRTGEQTFLEDIENVVPPLDLQLVVLKHLPLEEERDRKFFFNCYEGMLEEVERALQALQSPNLDPRLSPLFFSAVGGHTEVVRLLLEAGADTEWHAGENNERRALHYAAAVGNEEVVRSLLEFGADKDAKDVARRSPLHYAAQSREARVVQLLLDFGAEKDAKDAREQRPLHIAASFGGVEAVRVLLDHNSDQDRTSLYVEEALKCFSLFSLVTHR